MSKELHFTRGQSFYGFDCRACGAVAIGRESLPAACCFCGEPAPEQATAGRAVVSDVDVETGAVTITTTERE
jgi:hypothetical protein